MLPVVRDTRSPDPTCDCKLGRMARAYDLSDVDIELTDAWTGAGDTRSTRDLAHWFNQELLDAALVEVGVVTKPGDVENYYRLLTGDDVNSADRVQARKELARDGIDVDDLLDHFLSHQTVYNHLTGCLGLSQPDSDDAERLDTARETLGALQHRTERVAADSLERLAATDALDGGQFDVYVSTTVTCQDCYSQYTFQELLEMGGCDCSG